MVRRGSAASARGAPSVSAGPPWWACALIFALAFAVRMVMLAHLPLDYVLPRRDWEIEATAWSLVETGRYADPYAVPTGPTAHNPPAYPFLLSLVWRVFGLGEAGGYAAWIMNSAFASLQCALLPWFSVTLGLGLAPGLAIGAGTALFAQWPQDIETLTIIALGLLMLAFRRRWTARRVTIRGSLLLGAAAGAAFHLHPVLLAVVLGFLAFELWWLRSGHARLAAGAVVCGMALACVPWAWRNYTVLDGVFFIRSNFGLELLIGNHEGARPDIDAMLPSVYPLHPRASTAQARRVRELGEAAFMREAGAQARAWIAANPWDYARLSAARAFAFWTRSTDRGLVTAFATVVLLLAAAGWLHVRLTLGTPEKAALLIPLLAFPPVYYFVDYLPRYRTPVIWILYLLAAAELWYWVRRRRGRSAAAGDPDEVPGPATQPQSLPAGPATSCR